MENLDLEKVSAAAMNLVSTWGLSVLGALAVLILGGFCAKIIRAWARRALGKTKFEPTLIPFLSNLVYYGIWAFILIAVLGLFGIPTTSFVALLGAAGLAVGLALQGTLSNFAAGVMILVFRPFKVGDYVEAGGDEGIIQEVGVFASVLNTLDNVRIILPNSAIWGAKIRNYTANPIRRVDIPVGISYGDDIEKAKQVIRQVIEEEPRVLTDHETLVVVTGLGDSSVDLLVAPWCKPGDYWAMRWDLIQKIKERLEANGCSIPFPQRDVHMVQA